MVLKTLAAKMLSSHFNKASFSDKMQDALRKVPPSPPAVPPPLSEQGGVALWGPVLRCILVCGWEGICTGEGGGGKDAVCH